MTRNIKVFLMLFIFMFILGFGEQIGKINALNHEADDLIRQKAILVQEVKDVSRHVAQLEDNDCIEQLARENLNMVYRGEQCFVSGVLRDGVLAKTAGEEECYD